MPRFRFTHPRYEAGAVLGLGAQAVVLRVTDRDFPNRSLVAKVFRHGAFDPDLLRGEFALLSRLHVPGLARAHDFDADRDSGAPFLIEDFVDGPDATTWVAQAGDARPRIERAAALLAGVASTLASLHDAGFVHGDLKPVHVRVPSDSRPRLIDLGAAVLCGRGSREAPGARAFTRGYASPELISGARPGPRSDLYALGAVMFAVLGQKLPDPDRGAPSLRGVVPFAPPSLADLVDRLVALHPEDRPPDARTVLRALGENFPSDASRPRATRFQASASALREPVLSALGEPRSGVRYLAGAAGSGKSHVLCELHTRALLSGRPARLLRFPAVEPKLLSDLIRFLRTGSGAPFSEVGGELLLLLDDVHAAPAEVLAALEVFRCRPRDAPGADWDVIAGVRRVPERAQAWTLEPLDLAGTEQLLSELGEPEERARDVHEVSGGNAGFVVAMLGRVPLTRDAALSRVRALSAPARFLLAAVAVLKGHMPAAVAEALLGADVAAVTAELHASALLSRTVTRDVETVHSLSHPDLAEDLAEALADFDVADRLADALLSVESPGAGRAEARTLLSVAGAPRPPERREELLAEAANRAAAEGLRGDQVEALLALAANPKNRRKDVLLSLDRGTRGGGSSGLHPELVSWLAEGACTEPSLRVLSLRRQAEQSARAGDVPAARKLAEEALRLAEESGDPADRALAYSTLGSMALYSADWGGADDALARASACLRDGLVEDDEELARIHHNRGVVALYRMRLPEAREAFEHSLVAKREMGDRGGMWACLLNLGLTLAKLRDYDGAERALVEATLLCKSLGQRAGVSWCQVAFADVAVRRGDRHEAERRIAEAEHFGEALPEPVRADLSLLRAETWLLAGSGDAALHHVKKIAPALRSGDVMLGARALVVEARAHLCRLPVDARRAARLCLQAIRLARGARLPEPEAEATEILRRARALGRKPMTLANGPSLEYPPPVTDDGLFRYLGAVARGATRTEAAGLLARAIAVQSGAERVFVAALDEAFAVTWAAGADLDGLDVADPASRVDIKAVVAAGTGDGVMYERDVETRGGRGCRLAAVERISTGGYAAVVVEHRFAIGAFDSVTRERAEEWAILAALAVFRARTTPHEHRAPGEFEVDGRFAEESPSVAASEPSTAVPRRRTRTFPGIVGTGEALGRALDRLDAAVDSDLPVLVTGETGSGKELFAKALHEHGPRSKGPFVAVNCGAIHDSLFEAEIFGHAKGGFTGAERHRTGLIATAEGGVLFLDEIGEVPLARQAALLRVLATRRYRPVGADDERPFDVRIVAATNRDLEQEVKLGRFRRDLLYRLNVLEVEVPPLRSRPEDIVPLARSFLSATGSGATLSPSAERALEAYAWPGNVRELEHQMQRLAALRVKRVELEHLGREIRATRKAPAARKMRAAVTQKIGVLPGGAESERRQVQSALEAAQGNITQAAHALSITRQGLKKKMVRLGLRVPGAFARGKSK